MMNLLLWRLLSLLVMVVEAKLLGNISKLWANTITQNTGNAQIVKLDYQNIFMPPINSHYASPAFTKTNPSLFVENATAISLKNT